MTPTIHIENVQTLIIGGGIACSSSSSTEAVTAFLERLGQRECVPAALPRSRTRQAIHCEDCRGTGFAERNCSGEVGDFERVECPTCSGSGRA